MQTAKLPKRGIVQCLQADGDTIDAGEPVPAEARRFDTGWISFERDLHIGGDRPALRNRIKHCLNCSGLHERWSAAAEKDGGDDSIRNTRRRRRDLGCESAHETRLIQFAMAHMAVEIAIGAFREAERPMNVEAEGRGI